MGRTEEEIAKALETFEDLIIENRARLKLFKHGNGLHLSPVGKAAIEYLVAQNMTHANISKLLGITRGAVSAYMRKIEEGEAQSALR